MSSQIPATRETAINALVELDVQKWGEAEREASRQLHAPRTYGLALNALANAAEVADAPEAAALRQAATKALTAADWRWLRKAG